MNKPIVIACTDPQRLFVYQDALARHLEPIYVAGSFDTAKDVLIRVRPNVLLAEVRLREYNGLHLALWTRIRFPEVRSVLIGTPDAVLEGDARLINCAYVHMGDMQDVVAATLEAASRDKPRRRWVRRTLSADVAIDVDGHPARVVDLSYGGLRFEVHTAEVARGSAALPVAIPQFGVRAEVTCRWTRAAATPGAFVCGAALSDDDARAGSRWRGLVDAIAHLPAINAI
jgi:hypothetical protein